MLHLWRARRCCLTALSPWSSRSVGGAGVSSDLCALSQALWERPLSGTVCRLSIKEPQIRVSCPGLTMLSVMSLPLQLNLGAAGQRWDPCCAWPRPALPRLLQFPVRALGVYPGDAAVLGAPAMGQVLGETRGNGTGVALLSMFCICGRQF